MMKLKLCFMLIIGFCMAACTAETQKFSCDETVDSWVKNHLVEISSMDRTAWLHSSENLSRGIYNAFTPAQRIAFWTEKINEVKQLDWTTEEREHIELVQQFIDGNKELFEFENLPDEQRDVVDQFFYKWRNTAKKELAWDDTIVKSIVMTGMSVKNKKGELLNMFSDNSKARMTLSVEVDCNCTRGTFSDFCEAGSECLEDPGCDEVGGCGILWLSKCNGRCGIYGIGPA